MDKLKRTFWMLILSYCFTLTCGAQDFLQHLRASKGWSATITVKQSKDIDRLVNGDTISRKSVTPTQRTAADTDSAKANKVGKTPTGANLPPTVNRHRAETDDVLPDIPVIDMRKKVLRRAIKVNGYRVQVLAGGNSRADKQRVQQAGTTVKMAYPDEPVYVHFYSPRWICRVGNYRTYEEANDMLVKVRKLGFKQAIIVKGKITVQY